MRLFLFLIITIFLLLQSCVKEALRECPYQYKIQLLVKDKNYSNASSLGVSVDENLPFGQYVSNYCYTLRNIASGNTIATSSLLAVNGDENEVSFLITDLPEGEYELMVWGNIQDDHNPVVGSGVVHPNETEGSDLYLATDTLLIAAYKSVDQSLGLERVKGKLWVMFDSLPDDISRIEEHITNVYQTRDNRTYSSTTNVGKIFTESVDSLDVLETFLAPSVIGSQSILNLSLYAGESDSPTLIVDPMDVSIDRNKITAIRLNYSALYNRFEAWIHVDEEWIFVERLDLF